MMRCIGMLVVLLSVAADGEAPFVNSIGMELVAVDGYMVGRYEVTQREYERVMGNNPSHWVDPDRPVENVDWIDAQRFCERLTEMEKSSGSINAEQYYNLPTEAQWETFVADAKVNDMVHARWDGLDALGTRPVGSLGANALGLYDVRGNVWEWCRDWWDGKQNEKVLRGGSWDLVHPDDLDASYRPVSAAVARNGNIGFRVVLETR